MSLIPPCPQARSQQEAQRAALQEPRHGGAKLMAEGSLCSQERSEAGFAEQGELQSCSEPLMEPQLGPWGRPGIASGTGWGVVRQRNKQLRTKGETQSWVSLQNSPGSRKILDKRKTNTMNLSERLPWVCAGTNPSDSPSRTSMGSSSHCLPALLTSPQGRAQLPVPHTVCNWS